jgi:predicted helicase
VDTLDHAAFHLKQMDLFAMSVENTQRIQNQNDRNISVIIGNPPYNANQQNENDNNKNRKYPAIDKRIKDTYIEESTAQKTKLYDMYSRFFRWATDRLGENGIIAFITNSSFIDARTFDGFRKVVAEEFSEIYIVDLGGNIRAGDKTGNVFNIMVGVSITFLVKKVTGNSLQTACNIFYTHLPQFETVESKLSFLSQTRLEKLSFDHIIPDDKYNWVNISDNDFKYLLLLADKDTKIAKILTNDKSIFKLFSLGVSTNRDEWIIDYSLDNLCQKMLFFIDFYENHQVRDDNEYNSRIKWSESLKKHRRKNSKELFDKERIIQIFYRPYTKFFCYNSDIFIDRIGSSREIFFGKSENQVIIYSFGQRSTFSVLVTKYLFSLDIFLPNATQCLPLYRYDKEGNRIDNITDWGLQQFQNHYNDKNLTKLDIFHYTYAVLHHPEYRSKYELNLKREFPRLPFYDNFYQWVEWGSKLMELHINYETVAPYPLTRIDTNNNLKPKTKLKADREKNSINLDDITFLQDIPKIAWEYKLGNRSALEWILDQYKEKKPKDQTIAERFNNYRFVDYKETVIDLLQRVCTVSVETMKIIEAMRH